jgi:hypothetical protein
MVGGTYANLLLPVVVVRKSRRVEDKDSSGHRIRKLKLATLALVRFLLNPQFCVTLKTAKKSFSFSSDTVHRTIPTGRRTNNETIASQPSCIIPILSTNTVLSILPI